MRALRWPPAASATGRPRVYCTPACRKAAYEDRRARRPGALQVKLVDRIVVEQPVESHGIAECVHRVTQSPRAVANVLTEPAAMARARGVWDFDRVLPFAKIIALVR